ncbi:MAG: hypothetical protein GX107_03865 [Clostridiales bacterium]|nr:hypothetical protein [Clostridiales bacterium]
MSKEKKDIRFRKAFIGGFKRESVAEYIEGLQKELFECRAAAAKSAKEFEDSRVKESVFAQKTALISAENQVLREELKDVKAKLAHAASEQGGQNDKSAADAGRFKSELETERGISESLRLDMAELKKQLSSEYSANELLVAAIKGKDAELEALSASLPDNLPSAEETTAKMAAEIENVKAEAAAEDESAKAEMAAEIESVKAEAAAEVERAKSEAAAEVESAKAEMAEEIEKIKTEAAAEIDKIKVEAAAKVESAKAEAAESGHTENKDEIIPQEVAPEVFINSENALENNEEFEADGEDTAADKPPVETPSEDGDKQETRQAPQSGAAPTVYDKDKIADIIARYENTRKQSENDPQ